MATLTAFSGAPEQDRLPPRKVSLPSSLRKYAMGQQVRVKMHNEQWQNGLIVAFGNQEYLPLYWIKIDGIPQEALAFEFELSAKDGN